MSIDFEHRIAETPPRIRQLRQLASIGIKSAIERDRFRTLSRNSSTHYFVDEFTKMIGGEDDEIENDVFLPFEVRHRMAIRVGVRPPDGYVPKTWSLKFFETYFTRPYTPDRQWHAARSTYRFEWVRDRITMADRSLQLVGFDDMPGEGELDYSLEHFNVPSDIIGLLAVEDELRMVTEEDCDELIEDAREYFTTIEELADRQ